MLVEDRWLDSPTYERRHLQLSLRVCSARFICSAHENLARPDPPRCSVADGRVEELSLGRVHDMFYNEPVEKCQRRRCRLTHFSE